MAYDKVVDSSVLDAGLKAIADAIREKAGTSDNLAFPTAMAEAVAAIEAGGAIFETDFTPTTDVKGNTSTTYITIEHNLGVVPKLILLVRADIHGTVQNELIMSIYHTLYDYGYEHSILIYHNKSTAGDGYTYAYVTPAVTASSSAATSNLNNQSVINITPISVTVVGQKSSSTVRLKAGVTYRMVVIG
jgi:hypothetical protein